jgi:hypothetical protein
MDNEPELYRAFLLRLWPQPGGWRASLEDARSGERLGFASLEDLFAHLLQLSDHNHPNREKDQ